MNYLFISSLLALLNQCFCSTGNESPFFRTCVSKCTSSNCTNDGSQFLTKNAQPMHLKLLRWSCRDECGYECMWKTVEGFQARNYKVPQFYGKWPFIRVLGVQEPASAVFSFLNLHANVKMLKVVSKEVRPGTPLLWMWYIYGFICCHAWIWSMIFHTRDLHFTEFMDYASAFSMVLISGYCVTMRVLMAKSPIVLILVTVFFLTFFVNHVAYLYMGRFDYGYNMKVNIVVGAYTIMSWITWSFWNRKTVPHVWKIVLFTILVSFTTLLEIIDVPPIFWVFDFHALWHLSTIPIVYILYSFIIDDCKHLHKLKLERQKFGLNK